ncbi:MAG: hypothetical protein JO166_07085 [Deltaproteobacteria bacterium]|nr:hypothetical protein [Deltaproteobacteria bacterium]
MDYHDRDELIRDSLIPALMKEIGPLPLPSEQRKLFSRPNKWQWQILTRQGEIQHSAPLKWQLNERAWQRLRICSCGRVFVAVVTTAVWCHGCSNRLRQRRFYEKNKPRLKKIKLAAYHAKHKLHIERMRREVGLPDLRGRRSWPKQKLASGPRAGEISSLGEKVADEGAR